MVKDNVVSLTVVVKGESMQTIARAALDNPFEIMKRNALLLNKSEYLDRMHQECREVVELINSDDVSRIRYRSIGLYNLVLEGLIEEYIFKGKPSVTDLFKGIKI